MESAARLDGVRRVNLSRILRILHEEGPQSRATLTARTGLNRSTIAGLVGELVADGVVVERAPDPAGRAGRPSPAVSFHPDLVAIAANPEVDALTIGVVGLDRSVRRRARIARDELLTPHETAELIGATIAAWREDDLASARIVGVGLAVPGLVRASDGMVRRAPHLCWTDVDLPAIVRERTGLPTVVANDASLGALAEHRYGAARGVADLVYLNGGASGIGGGIVVGGVPLSGAGGYAGEFGHNRPGIADPADSHAENGLLEDEVSRARLLGVLDLTDADEPTLASALATSTDAVVANEVERQRAILATALANAANVLNPSVVVLGGFLATLAELDQDALVSAVRAQCMPECGEDLQVRVAALGEDRLLVGAASVAFEPLLSRAV